MFIVVVHEGIALSFAGGMTVYLSRDGPSCLAHVPAREREWSRESRAGRVVPLGHVEFRFAFLSVVLARFGGLVDAVVLVCVGGCCCFLLPWTRFIRSSCSRESVSGIVSVGWEGRVTRWETLP